MGSAWIFGCLQATPPPRAQLELYVRALAPKILFQRGITILHASACVARGKLIAFAGLSGAGKTTMVRAFADAGARLVSEDLVAFSSIGQTAVLTDAESLIHRWAERTSLSLLAVPRVPIPSGDLADALGGPTHSLDRILFLDRGRRKGTDLTALKVDEATALIALLQHNFLGSNRDDSVATLL